MSIENAILGLLSLRPATGYDLKKMFERSMALYWSGNNNQIYRALVQLHHDQLVSMEVQHQSHGPFRKVYTLTAKGAAALNAWLRAAPELPQVRHMFLIQLAWADQLEPRELDDLLARYEEAARDQISMLRAQRQPKDGAPPGDYVDPSQARSPREKVVWGLIQDNWVGFYEHELEWVRKLRKALTAA